MLSHNVTFYIFIFMLFIFFLVVSLGFLTALFDNCKIWTYGSGKPIVTATSKVVNKRVRTLHDAQSYGDMIPSYNYVTSFYVTFEIESGENLEFSLTDVEFERIDLGDTGKLSYQGTRFLAFEKVEGEIK